MKLNNLVLLVVTTCFQLSSATITEHPENFTVTLGDNATFHCASTHEVDWIILYNSTEDILDSSDYDDSEKLEEIGIKTMLSGSPPSVRISLFMPAVEMNNNTVVTCRERIQYGEFSNDGSLKILGPPSPPEPQLSFVNSSVLIVDWFTPFSWKNHSVTHYNITVKNSSRNEIQSLTTNETEFHYSKGGEDDCDLLIFNITASSDIGESVAGSVSGGFPIAPGIPEFVECVSECQVTFLGDGTPQIKAFVNLPPLCPYQSGEYNVTVMDRDSPDKKANVLSGEYSQSSNIQGPIKVTVTSGLQINRTYLLIVTVSSCEMTSTIEQSYNTEFAPLNREGPTMNKQEIVNIAIAAGVVIGILILAVLLIMSLVVFKNIQRKSSAARSNAELTSNSISSGFYHQPEGNLMYETIDCYQTDEFNNYIDIKTGNSPPLPFRNCQQRNDITVLHDKQALQDAQIAHGDEIENGTYLQFLSRDHSTDSVPNEVDNMTVPKSSQTESVSSNDEYTTMKSIGSLRNNQTSVVSATNKMADMNVSENNYNVIAP